MAPQQQLTNEQFIEQLSRLFESSSKAHSVFVSHKRISQGTTTDEPSIVVRATDGRGTAAAGRTKFTTHVPASQWKTFQDAYSTLLRTSMAGFLRKRDKAKERRVDKQLKEKRKRMEEALQAGQGPSVNGGKETKSTSTSAAAAGAPATASTKAATTTQTTTPPALKVTHIGAKRGAGRRKRQQALRKAKVLRKEAKRLASTATAGGHAAAVPSASHKA